MADNPTTTSVVRIYRFPALPKAMLARIYDRALWYWRTLAG